MNKVVVLSGGLDSTILTYKTQSELKQGEKLFAITYNYGQRHNIEIEKAKLTCSKLGIEHRVIDISFIGDIIAPVSALSAHKQVAMPTINQILGDPQPPSYVPFRNLLLTSMALTFAESVKADTVLLGLQSIDEYSYWDTSESFVQALNGVSNLNRINRISIEAPFIKMSKRDEILIGVSLGVPFEDTWTCYSGEEGHGACGTCPSCSERIMNFAKAGIKDPCPYAVEIDWERLFLRAQ